MEVLQGQMKFKQLLDEKYVWPCDYMFKFVVPKDSYQNLLQLFSEQKSNIKERESTKGRYKSITLTMNLQSSAEVISIYERVRSIEGIVCL